MGTTTQIKSMKIHDRDYIQTGERLRVFREEHPNWSIQTSAFTLDEKQAIFKADIFNEKGEHIATGHRKVLAQDFRDYVEKSETQAVGRALAKAGYGTESLMDMDGVEILADSPVGASTTPPPQNYSTARSKTYAPLPEEEKLDLLDRIQRILDQGPNKFMESLSKQLQDRGSLSKKQIDAIAKFENQPMKFKQEKPENSAPPKLFDDIPPPTDSDIPF